jgi:hypothetical protein
VTFDRHVHLRTLPHGARVFRGDSLLGTTPCDIPIGAGNLRVESLGYQGVLWDPASSSRQEILLLLDPLDESVPSQMRIHQGTLRLPRPDILIPAGVGLAAGVAAVILKQKADGYYDDYLISGDDSFLSQTKKYDIYAGISLALLQLGLGYIIYRLFDG